MTQWVVGQTLSFGLKTYAADGVTLADVGSGPTAIITLPDGVTTASGSVTKASTGTNYANLTATVAGRYRCTWSGSGANSGGLPYVDYADVQPATPRMLVPLSEARDALNLPAGTTVHDDELLGYIYASTLVIEDITGPILPDTRTEVHDGDGSTTLYLYAYPTAVSSVVEDTITLPATAYKAGKGGVLHRLSGVWSSASPANITVTYSVGATPLVIPENILKAAREQVRFLYQQGQQGARPNLGAPTGGGIGYSAGYAVPNRVRELLAGDIGRHKPLGID
jgi:hypothetical protein